uniref:Sushi domain-containing protein n=1 Tax=Caenorhabditis tropicalis TaxID=1561998 RepID=A0A1I7UW68_9PELO
MTSMASSTTSVSGNSTTSIPPTNSTTSSPKGASSSPPTSTPKTSPGSSIPTPTSTPFCPSLNLDLNNTVRPTSEELREYYFSGDQVVHTCKKYYVFEKAGQPLKIYQCQKDGTWAGKTEKCIESKKYEL